MSTLVLTREQSLANLLESAASTITVDILRRSRTGTHLRTEFRNVYDTIVRGLEDGDFSRDTMPEYAAFAIDQLLQAARGTSFRTERMTSSQILFRAAQRLEEAISALRSEPKDSRDVD
jgi:hypothetical protein